MAERHTTLMTSKPIYVYYYCLRGNKMWRFESRGQVQLQCQNAFKQNCKFLIALKVAVFIHSKTLKELFTINYE